MHLELQAKGAIVDGRLVPLTRSEQALLAWLVAHPGVPQSREVLLAHVWGYARGARSRTVDTTMNRLRAKLDAAGSAALRTIRGHGWVYAPPAQDVVRGPFVGRAAELRALTAWLDGGGALLTVTGEPGIGKSALVAHAADPRVRRVDADALPDAEGWYRTVDGVGETDILWLDGADERLYMLRSVLAAGVPRGRRVIVTCRRPLGVPGESLLPVGPLSPAEAASLAGQVDVDADNPRVIVGPPSAVARALERSWPGLSDAERAALRRMAAIAPALPTALAERLAGGAEFVAALADAGLLRRPPGRVVVPEVVRRGVPAVDDAEARAIAERWVRDVVAPVHRAGDVQWIPFLRGLDAELDVLAWVVNGGAREPASVALAALDDHHRLVDGRVELGAVFDAAVHSVGPTALLRRASWRGRLGDVAGAEADRAAFDAAVGDDAGLDGARARLGAAMRAAQDRDEGLATALSTRALAWAEGANDPVIEATARFVLAQVALDRGEVAVAERQARAARAVAIGDNRHGHTVTSFYARYLHEAGRDDEARVALAESRAIAVRIGFDAGVALSDAMAGWMAVTSARDPAGIAALDAACAALDAPASPYAAGTRLRLAWAEIVAGSAERGLSILRSTLDPARGPAPADVAHARAFAVAARVRLGLSPRAAWMVAAHEERDPGVRAIVDGLEAAAARDLDGARARDDEVRGVTTSRVRALRWVLGDAIRGG